MKTVNHGKAVTIAPNVHGTVSEVYAAIRPASVYVLVIQSLQIQEVHTWPHSNVQFTHCLHPTFSTGFISALLLLYDSKQSTSSAFHS